MASLVAILIVSIALCSISALAILTTSGAIRAFWLGIAIPAGIVTIVVGVAWTELLYAFEYEEFGLESDALTRVGHAVRTASSFLWCMAPMNGLLCAFVQRLIWPTIPASENQISK